MDEPDDETVEYEPVFVGCTCDHDPEDHGWGECLEDDCPCEGGWEE